jgi:hypothetical protein
MEMKPGGYGITEAIILDEEHYEEILSRITALCKGFLLVADKSIEKACSFCRGLLILLNQLFEIMPQPSEE